MSARAVGLQRFLDDLQGAILARTDAGGAARVTAGRVFDELERPGTVADVQPGRLPACRHLDAALATAAETSDDLASVTASFAAIEPALAWYRRPDADAVGEPFAGAHANAIVVGPGGIERRDDVWIGCSLVGPRVRYPDHHHPPAEVYLVLSSGEWRQEREPWWTPGPGGIVHNPPDIVHAMRSGAEPLFAIWCLSIG